MGNNKGHPLAHILRAVANGEALQLLRNDKWFDVYADEILSEVASRPTTVILRIKPDSGQLLVGALVVKRPMEVDPEIGTKYYHLESMRYGGIVAEYEWESSPDDARRLFDRLCWLERRDAVLAGQAILEILRGN